MHADVRPWRIPREEVSFLRELRTFPRDLLCETRPLRPDVPSGLQPGSQLAHGEILLVCMCLGVQTRMHICNQSCTYCKKCTHAYMSYKKKKGREGIQMFQREFITDFYYTVHLFYSVLTLISL